MHICYLESIRSPDGGTLSCNTLSCGTRDYCTLLHLRPRHLKLWHVKFRHLRKNTLCTGTSSRGCVQWIPAGRAEPNTWNLDSYSKHFLNATLRGFSAQVIGRRDASCLISSCVPDQTPELWLHIHRSHQLHAQDNHMS